MDLESPEWKRWEDEFFALAEGVPPAPRKEAVKGASHYLCLYGENGLSQDEEFQELAYMRDHKTQLQKVEVDTSYWQDTVLFIP